MHAGKEGFMMTLEFLEGVDLFKGMDDKRLERILNCCEFADFRRGERLFAAGNDADFLWVVIDGEVELRDEDPGTDAYDNAVISTLSEHMAFGWSSLVSPYKYHFSTICISRTCKVLQVERNCLIRLMEEDSEMGYPIMSRLLTLAGQRYDQLEEEIIRRLGQDIINQW